MYNDEVSLNQKKISCEFNLQYWPQLRLLQQQPQTVVDMALFTLKSVISCFALF